MSKDTFNSTEIPDDPGRSYEVLARQANERGYVLTAIRMPYYEVVLTFIQVDFPDGTSAYFTPTGEGDVVAGPFGGGYSWACPKYVVEAVIRLANETFQVTEEEVPA